jgi:drug/metabolite transporter (DMT)-like permease
MTPTAWILLGAMMVFDAASHLMLKASSARAHADPRDMHFLRRLFRVPMFWVAIAAFLAMMVVWIGFYSHVPLAQGVMAGSITIAGVMLGGRIFFGERITGARAIAALLIAAGVLLVGWERP